MAILSIISGNLLLGAFLMDNFNLGIAKMSVISKSVTSENLCWTIVVSTESKIWEVLYQLHQA